MVWLRLICFSRCVVLVGVMFLRWVKWCRVFVLLSCG